MTHTSDSIRIGSGDTVKLGDRLHLGLAELYGCGFTGTLIEIKGDHLTLEAEGRTWCGRSGLACLEEDKD